MSIRDRFKSIRESREMSQKALSKLSGLSNGMICRYERGLNDITLENLVKLLHCLGSSPSELFADEEQTILLFEVTDLTTPIGELYRVGDYDDCYAITNKERGIFPIDSITIINPNSDAVEGDITAYIYNGKLMFEHFRQGQNYCGVVVETQWTYFR